MQGLCTKKTLVGAKIIDNILIFPLASACGANAKTKWKRQCGSWAVNYFSSIGLTFFASSLLLKCSRQSLLLPTPWSSPVYHLGKGDVILLQIRFGDCRVAQILIVTLSQHSDAVFSWKTWSTLHSQDLSSRTMTSSPALRELEDRLV